MAALDPTNHGQATGDAQRSAGPGDHPLSDPGQGSGTAHFDNLEFILDVPLEISVELGRTRMVINDLLKLSQGSVIELTKLAGESLDILANQRLIARGEVVVSNEKYAIRLTEIISPVERVERLR